MRTNDITRLLPARTAAPTPQQMATRGTVTIPPASIADDAVTVTLPSYSADYGWPCRWIRQANALPAIGAECLVLWDETGAGTVVQWAGAGVALPTVADVAALDARLDALEALPIIHRGSSSATWSTAIESADVIIPHGLGVTPAHAEADPVGTAALLYSVMSKDATNITVRGRDTRNTNLAGTFSFTWAAMT